MKHQWTSFIRGSENRCISKQEVNICVSISFLFFSQEETIVKTQTEAHRFLPCLLNICTFKLLWFQQQNLNLNWFPRWQIYWNFYWAPWKYFIALAQMQKNQEGKQSADHSQIRVHFQVWNTAEPNTSSLILCRLGKSYPFICCSVDFLLLFLRFYDCTLILVENL